ncbi:uncharacterized protein N7500_006049 [Penicillium coprophilum]|uniref:uncharacterized protein n=1 Tax=Penicillium coprophilum TaxID=36646 RepID=UPI0023897535|nr:uncharacterized protein N7500_006049 [Penicillium coprophilum]KAJ5164219.1 hypothetical protein N7500_006049 [Penicillium coprophilum]
MSNTRIAFKVHGTVQGVGFRDFTQKCAKLDEVKGWVRNTTCGRVEGEAQGSDEKVKKFLQRIDKGPSMAHVVKLEKRDLDVRDDEEGFAVMRTAESMFKSGN